MPHVDWLTVRQSHGFGSCPIFSDGKVMEIDCETGDRRWEVYKSKKQDGSHRSSLQIRSDGDTVSVSGNPSRWNREDNLFGVRSVAAAIDVYNRVLADSGLPAFHDDDSPFLSRRLLQGSDASLARNGLVIGRVDVTENYATGGPQNSEQSLHALRSFRHRNRSPADYGTTLQWGGGRGKRADVAFKYYLKGPEMVAHRRRRDGDSSYWDRLLSFVQSAGVLRFEVRCQGQFLRREGLNVLSKWSSETMESIMERFALHGRASASVSSWDQIAEQLIALGYSERRAFVCQREAKAYIGGENLREGRHVSTFYRLRADLLKVGIDINAPSNVSSLKFAVKNIELRPLAMPAWYQAA